MADDIRVRLSPEGERQVKDAFRSVERESQRASRVAAGGVNSITRSLAGMKRQIIGIVGAYAGFRGVQSLLRGVIRNTIEQERAVAAVESRIKSTGGAAGVTSDELVKMARNLQQATTFADEDILTAQSQLLTFTKITRENFEATTEAALNLSTVMGTDLRSSVVQIGKALNDPILGITALQRTGIQFTASQREMIRSLVETGQTAAAQRVILAELETQFGGAARAARNTLGGAFQALGNAAGDLLEADRGLPGITGSVNELTDTLNDPAVREGFQVVIGGILEIVRVGVKAVTAIGQIAAGLRLLATGPDDPILQLDDRVAALDKRINRLQTGLFGRTQQGQAVLEGLLAERKRLVDEWWKLVDEEATRGPAPAPEITAGPIDIDRRLGLRTLQADLQAAGTLLSDELRRAREVLDRELEQGLITYADYFQRRAALELRQIDQTLAQRRTALQLIDEEIRLLDQRGESIEQQESRRKQLVAEIIVLERQRGDVGVKAAQDLQKAEQDLARQRFAFEQQFLELQGRGREARLRDLDEQLEGFRKLLRAQGVGLDEIEARLGRFRELTVVRLDFDQALQDGQRALEELDRIRMRLRTDVEAGLITQFQAEQQILAIEQQRVILLREIADAARESAQALGDPAAIASAEQFNEQVRQLELGINRLAKDMVALEEGTQDAFRGSLQGVLSQLGHEITSLSGAVTAFAQNFVRQIQNIASEILARRATFALLGAFGGSFTGIGGQGGGGGPGGFAAGGYVRGPGTATSDSIPAYLSDREFVVRASVVDQPGMLDLLQYINGGGLRRMPRMTARIPRFNQGGQVTAGDFGRRAERPPPGGIAVTVFANEPQRFREAEGRLAASVANAQAIAAGRNS